MSFTGYRVYRGEGGLADVDFTTPVASVAGVGTSVEITSAGHRAGATYTYVVRPVLDDLESPDVGCLLAFATNAAGEWLGTPPPAPQVLEATPLTGGQVRLRWTHRTPPGAEDVDEFTVYYAITPPVAAGQPQQTVAATGDGTYTVTLDLSAGVTYWLAVGARSAQGAESPLTRAPNPVCPPNRTPPTPSATFATTLA